MHKEILSDKQLALLPSQLRAAAFSTAAAFLPMTPVATCTGV